MNRLQKKPLGDGWTLNANTSSVQIINPDDRVEYAFYPPAYDKEKALRRFVLVGDFWKVHLLNFNLPDVIYIRAVNALTEWTLTQEEEV